MKRRKTSFGAILMELYLLKQVKSLLYPISRYAKGLAELKINEH
jgi:hypothetical protein